jgi:hypothetical protein
MRSDENLKLLRFVKIRTSHHLFEKHIEEEAAFLYEISVTATLRNITNYNEINEFTYHLFLRRSWWDIHSWESLIKNLSQ